MVVPSGACPRRPEEQSDEGPRGGCGSMQDPSSLAVVGMTKGTVVGMTIGAVVGISDRQCEASGTQLPEGSLRFACRLLTSSRAQPCRPEELATRDLALDAARNKVPPELRSVRDDRMPLCRRPVIPRRPHRRGISLPLPSRSNHSLSPDSSLSPLAGRASAGCL